MWRGIRKWAERAWRWIESVHTLVWLFPLGFATVVGIVGDWNGVQWYWVLICTPIAGAALLYMTQYIGANFGEITLREGAIIALQELRGSPWGYAAGITAKALDGQLDFMAKALANYAPVRGKRPPSEVYESIPPEEFRQGSMASGGLTFHRNYGGPPHYIGLMVRRRDILTAIERMRNVVPPSYR